MKWDEWRGSLDGRPTFYSKRIFTVFGWRVSIHKFVSTDDDGCFHSHPATAFRVILWGGYEEEIRVSAVQTYLRKRRPLHASFVQPYLVHRVHSLINGRASYSLWVRGPKTNQIELLGGGWAKPR